jgi:Ran GTPase-activating protein (RanGAP) involved in mRNA processing and transport
LEANQGIRTLSLRQCELHDDELATLVDAVRRHPSLAWLDLSENSIGPDTCEALVSLLVEDIDGIAGTTTSHLAGLTLIGCGIQDAEVTRLASALCSTNTMLKQLNLNENSISDTGIQDFAESLKQMPSLKTLRVLENSFAEDGAKALLDAVTVNFEMNMDELILDRHLACFDDIQYQILLNRCGRKLFKSHCAPLGLWPLVMERCQGIRHHCRRAGPADVLYHLLQGPALLNNPAFKQ